MQSERPRLRVLLVDDQVIVRRGFREAIDALCPDELQVAAEAGHGREALDMLAAGQFDAVLTDVTMPVMDGLELTRRIKAQWPHLPVVAFSTRIEPTLRAKLIDAGAEAVLDKLAPPDELCAALARFARAAGVAGTPPLP